MPCLGLRSLKKLCGRGAKIGLLDAGERLLSWSFLCFLWATQSGLIWMNRVQGHGLSQAGEMGGSQTKALGAVLMRSLDMRLCWAGVPWAVGGRWTGSTIHLLGSHNLHLVHLETSCRRSLSRYAQGLQFLPFRVNSRREFSLLWLPSREPFRQRIYLSIGRTWFGYPQPCKSLSMAVCACDPSTVEIETAWILGFTGCQA